MTDITKLLNDFNSFAYGKSSFTAFNELLDWSLLPFKFYNDSEEQLAILKKYQENPNIIKLSKLLVTIGDLSEGFCDPLGELYMQTVSSGRMGQYFTPEPICDMMTVLSGSGDNGCDNIIDPACGSGRMILAAAKVNRNNMFFAADLDFTCCKITLLNFLLNSLTGEIAHMNTLSNEFYHGYKIYTKIVDGFHYPYYIEFSNPEESYICLKPKKYFNEVKDIQEKVKTSLGIQGSLFEAY